MHLVQLANGNLRGVAVVQGSRLIILDEVTSIYELAKRALAHRILLPQAPTTLATGDHVLYDDVFQQNSPWQLIAPIDVPGAPQMTLVSGTGLTHLGSARERQAMHAETAKKTEAEMTDSMRMFEWGREKGRPDAGKIGIAPEWFYKGDGSVI